MKNPFDPADCRAMTEDDWRQAWHDLAHDPDKVFAQYRESPSAVELLRRASPASRLRGILESAGRRVRHSIHRLLSGAWFVRGA